MKCVYYFSLFKREQDFVEVVDKSVKDLQAKFREDLEEKCRAGAASVSTSFSIRCLHG
jgi:hypothetical protein